MPKVFRIIMDNPCYHNYKLGKFNIFERFRQLSEGIEDLGLFDEVEDLAENLFVRVGHSICEKSQLP